MTADRHPAGLDAHTIDLIAGRVAELLREDLEAIAADIAGTRSEERPLTVDDVAERFGIARSTVYSHWREWGGYKLGAGERSTIRFRAQALPSRPAGTSAETEPDDEAPPRRRRRGSLLSGKPRLSNELG